jgi:sirohydrochlorin ferrochelatase
MAENASSARTAILLVAHGSREQQANLDVHYVIDRLLAQGRYAIAEAAYLELAEPNIAEAGKRCVESGAELVIIVPYFLSAGIHVLRDLAEARSTLARTYPHVRVQLAEPLGQHPSLVEVILQRASEAERRQGATPLSDCTAGSSR